MNPPISWKGELFTRDIKSEPDSGLVNIVDEAGHIIFPKVPRNQVEDLLHIAKYLHQTKGESLREPL